MGDGGRRSGGGGGGAMGVGKDVRCVAFHGRLLFLGTSDGVVFVVRFASKKKHVDDCDSESEGSERDISGSGMSGRKNQPPKIEWEEGGGVLLPRAPCAVNAIHHTKTNTLVTLCGGQVDIVRVEEDGGGLQVIASVKVPHKGQF